MFKALLYFVYTDQLITKDGSSDHQTLSVELLQGLFMAANQFALDKLSQLCEEQLAKRLSVDTVAATLILADQYSGAGLKKKCLDFASEYENFSSVALTKGFFQVLEGSPTLVAELH